MLWQSEYTCMCNENGLWSEGTLDEYTTSDAYMLLAWTWDAFSRIVTSRQTIINWTGRVNNQLTFTRRRRHVVLVPSSALTKITAQCVDTLLTAVTRLVQNCTTLVNICHQAKQNITKHILTPIRKKTLDISKRPRGPIITHPMSVQFAFHHKDHPSMPIKVVFSIHKARHSITKRFEPSQRRAYKIEPTMHHFFILSHTSTLPGLCGGGKLVWNWSLLWT